MSALGEEPETDEEDEVSSSVAQQNGEEEETDEEDEEVEATEADAGGVFKLVFSCSLTHPPPTFLCGRTEHSDISVSVRPLTPFGQLLHSHILTSRSMRSGIRRRGSSIGPRFLAGMLLSLKHTRPRPAAHHSGASNNSFVRSPLGRSPLPLHSAMHSLRAMQSSPSTLVLEVCENEYSHQTVICHQPIYSTLSLLVASLTVPRMFSRWNNESNVTNVRRRGRT